MKPKIINIMNHPPAYEAYRNKPRPGVNWDLPNGEWVGIWGYDWHNIIGNKVLEISDEFEYEVWQPDLKVDKIYEHKFDNGLVHRLFPAKNKSFLYGFKLVKDVYSSSIMEVLEKEFKSGKEIILHLNGGFRYINVPILKKYFKKIKILGQFFTNSKDTFLYTKSKNPIKKLNALKKKFDLDDYYRKMKYIIPSISEGVDVFEKKFGTKVFYRDFANFGRDFKEWSRTKTVKEARLELGIEENKFVIFSSSRQDPVKQLDKMIVAFSKIKSGNYICYVSGAGTAQYENYLKKLVEENNLTDKIKFVGYVDFNILKDYYQAADLVLSTSYMEAGPAPVSNAAAMGIPTMLTATGIGYEFYKKCNAGIIVPVDDYNKWATELEEIINGKKIAIPSRKEVESYGDWNIISKYYLNVYKSILNT